jgi:membrane-associated protease RseP (regulator of RpoE activity)
MTHQGAFPPPSRPLHESDPPSEDEDDEAPEEVPLRWRTNLILFALTVVSVFLAGTIWVHGDALTSFADVLRAFPDGWVFAVPLLSILLVHEFGHFIAARLHGVPASLPYFIPLPFLGAGTMGAVIAMRGRIRSRNALLDIGASGPLAGMAVAIPVLIIGLSLSPVEVVATENYQLEGQSLLYMALKWLVVGPIPEDHDVYLHPTALAGWFGLLVTMLNLVPWGQLDGGHIAYALFGRLQNRFARWTRWALLVPVAYNIVKFVLPVALGRSHMPWSLAISNCLSWLIWFGVLGVIGRLAGDEHPPTERGPLSPKRRIVAWLSLALFLALFMPTPFAQY